MRKGHSLPELLVALTFVGVVMSATSAAALAAHRATAAADGRQRAFTTTAEVLDSLLLAPRVTDGEKSHGAWRIAWTVREEGEGTAVVVRTSVGGPGREVFLEGFWIPPSPVWPSPPDPTSPGELE